MVELPEVEAEAPAFGMTVNAGAEHDVVGADVRVTNWLVEVVVGHDSQTTVDFVVFAAASHVYAWKAAGADISFPSHRLRGSSRAYPTTRWQRRSISCLRQ